MFCGVRVLTSPTLSSKREAQKRLSGSLKRITLINGFDMSVLGSYNMSINKP
jgi:hypothetical protein